jgi:CcmD family protein
MKNFEFLFAAWMCVWAVFFVYEISVGMRLGRLRDEIESLKSQLRDTQGG